MTITAYSRPYSYNSSPIQLVIDIYHVHIWGVAQVHRTHKKCSHAIGSSFYILLDCSSDEQLTGYKGITGNSYCGQYHSGWCGGGMPSHTGDRFGAAATIWKLVITPG